MKKSKKTPHLIRQQGYFPGQTPLTAEQEPKRIRFGTERLAGGKTRGKLFVLVLFSGILLLTGGLWLIIRQRIQISDRIKTESQLRAVYYEDVTAKEGSADAVFMIAESALVTPNPLIGINPATSEEPRPRTFVTASPFKVFPTGERFLSLRRINKDVVGWLTIKDMLDLPVVQRDNSFYLTHDFQGLKSNSGTLFLDENFNIAPPNESLLIHGHNMRDGSMFGRLHQYQDRNFYINHWLIQFDTLYETGNYVVFAALDMVNDLSDPSYFQFVQTHFDTDKQFTEYISDLRNRSKFRCSLDVQPTDALLTLSTCFGGSEHFFVVVARRIRVGENYSDISKACKNSVFR